MSAKIVGFIIEETDMSVKDRELYADAETLLKPNGVYGWLIFHSASPDMKDQISNRIKKTPLLRAAFSKRYLDKLKNKK